MVCGTTLLYSPLENIITHCPVASSSEPKEVLAIFLAAVGLQFCVGESEGGTCIAVPKKESWIDHQLMCPN